MGSAYREAVRLRDQHELYTVPVRVEGEGADKSVLPLGEWSVYLNGKDPTVAFADLWDENTDAPALALVCGRRFGVVALDANPSPCTCAGRPSLSPCPRATRAPAAARTSATTRWASRRPHLQTGAGAYLRVVS